MNTLDKNSFYNLLLTTYRRKYDSATARCWLICIPNEDSFDPAMINDRFVNSHILKPSPLLKSHYIPANERQSFDVEINGTKLIVKRGNNNEEINIIGEEIAYNLRNQQYKILLIETTLINVNSRKISCQSVDKYENNNNKNISFEMSKNLLNNLSDEIVSMLENKINKLMNTYVVLPNYIEDAAERIKTVIDWGIELINTTCTSKVPNYEAAVESFVIGLIYEKLFPAIIKHCVNEDKILSEKFKCLIKQDIKPVQFGAQKVFSSFTVNSKILNELSNLHKKLTPMEKLRCFKNTLDLINEQVGQIVKESYSPILGTTNEPICVMSDDLIAIVICVLAQTKLEHLASEITFIQTFSWYLPRNNEFGYSFVTFEVAKEFIKNYDLSDQTKHSTSKTEKLRDSTILNTPEKSYSRSLNSMSPFDKELEKIAKMIGSCDIDSNKDNGDKVDSGEELGELLGSLNQNFTVGFGKQC